MKNIYKLLAFFVVGIYIIGGSSYAFLGEENGLNLYKVLDDGYTELELKNYESELSGTEKTIKDKVNKLIEMATQNGKDSKGLQACIKGDLAPSQIQAIANGDISLLYKKVGADCKNDENTISIAQLTMIQKVISEHYNTSISIGNEKSSQMQKIGSIGIYSNGIIEDGSFDLIEDLEQIDAIIFSNPILYDGSEYQNLKDSFEKKIDEKRKILEANTIDIEVLRESTGEEDAYIQDTGGKNIDFLTDFSSPSNNNSCILSNSNSGLDQSILDDLFKKPEPVLGNNLGNGNIGPEEIVNTLNNNSNGENTKNTPESITGNYKKINDNSQWPCSDFFCIMIDFQVYQQQLLGGGEDISIEYLLNRSNKHLRKFANASLTPAQMTIGNFELSFKNLNLADLFHMSFQIQTKPVPILRVDGNDTKGSNQYTANTLMEKYYKAYNLDYRRRNDLVIYNDEQNEYKTLLNSGELNISSVSERDQSLQTYLNIKAKKIDIISMNILKKGSYDTLGDFGNQFVELNNFSIAIKTNAEKLRDIVKAMKEKPTQ